MTSGVTFVFPSVKCGCKNIFLRQLDTADCAHQELNISPYHCYSIAAAAAAIIRTEEKAEWFMERLL